MRRASAFVVAGARWHQADGQVMFSVHLWRWRLRKSAVGLALVLRNLSPLQVSGRGRTERDEGLT